MSNQKNQELPKPSVREVLKKHKIYIKKELRDRFYRAAIVLAEKSWKYNNAPFLADAVSILLETWNRRYYAVRGGFKKKHLKKILNLIKKHLNDLREFQKRDISSFNDKEHSLIRELFYDFEKKLGPVGAAKALHVVAPHFFSLWDRDIAKRYVGALKKTKLKENGGKYIKFMEHQKIQVLSIKSGLNPGLNPLKVIDEYNYCCAKGWK